MPDSQVNTRKSLENQFENIVRARVNGTGYHFGPNAHKKLSALIRHGVAVLDSDNLLNDPEKIQEAEQNLERLISQMLVQQPGAGMLSQDHFRGAIISLCPGCWPFC